MARVGVVIFQTGGDDTRKALRLIHDDMGQPVLPLEGEHLAAVLVLEPGSVPKLDRKLIPFQDLGAVRDGQGWSAGSRTMGKTGTGLRQVCLLVGVHQGER